MNKNILEKEYDAFIKVARDRLQKRKAFKLVYISTNNFHHSSKNKAMFIVRDGIQYIELYRPSLIEHYIKYYPETIPFTLYLTSIIVHEFIHRDQYLKLFNRNFKYFKSMYECYPEQYENPAIKAEKRFIHYILHSRHPSWTSLRVL
ncbi:MAG: hypothetical protein LBT43_13865 [Prevotella sp.]|jgi:predicted small secreted protein|nr:hypothetical protein [Prevotella sp.]